MGHNSMRLLRNADISGLQMLYEQCFPMEYQWIEKDRFLKKTFQDPDICNQASLGIEEMETHELIAAILCKIAQPYEKEVYQNVAWISLLMVRPEEQQKGYASRLYEKAERVLREHGVKQIVVGMEFQNFFSGIPAPSVDNISFFYKYRFKIAESEHFDLTSDIRKNKKPDTLEVGSFADHYCVRTMNDSESDQVSLLDFLRREFPDRWLFEIKEYVRTKQDKKMIYLLLKKEDETVQGFCVTHNYKDRGKNGGLGPIGISKAVRGIRLGEFLLTQALMGLRKTGARNICIDWTQLDQYYEKYGFVKNRFYKAAEKTL